MVSSPGARHKSACKVSAACCLSSIYTVNTGWMTGLPDRAVITYGGRASQLRVLKVYIQVQRSIQGLYKVTSFCDRLCLVPLPLPVLSLFVAPLANYYKHMEFGMAGDASPVLRGRAACCAGAGGVDGGACTHKRLYSYSYSLNTSAQTVTWTWQ